MNTIRTMLVVLVLGAVCYGAYVSFSASPEPEPPPEAAEEWGSAPAVEMPVADADSPASPGVTVLDGAPVTADSSFPTSLDGASPWGGTETTATSVAGQGPPGPAAETNNPAADPIPWGSDASPSDASPSDASHSGAGSDAYAQSSEQHPLRAAPAPADQAASPYDGWSSQSAYAPTQPASDPSAAADSGAAGDSAVAENASAASGWPQQGHVATAETPPADGDLTQVQSKMTAIQGYLDQDRLVDALRELSPFYNDARLAPHQLAEVLELLDQLAGSVVFDYRHHLLEPAYTVQAGDSLETIAERYQVPWQLLAKINGIADPNGLSPGEQLKVIRGPFEAVVNLKDQQLVLFVKGMYAVRFGLNTKPETNLEPGIFQVRGKRDLPPGDPYATVSTPAVTGEPSGKWLELSGGQRIQMQNESPFVARSDGNSILLSKEDLGEVFDMLSVGSEVRILR